MGVCVCRGQMVVCAASKKKLLRPRRFFAITYSGRLILAPRLAEPMAEGRGGPGPQAKSGAEMLSSAAHH